MTQIQQEYERYRKVLQESGKTPRDFENFEKLVNKRLRREIKGGVKTLQYQLLTILCSNGQTPFISMSLNLEDCEGDKQWEEDTKIVFEEVLKQRIKGIPDKHGNLVPVIFPKLLYFLDERNNNPNTENWYLTKIAVESAAKTMAPDFISSKVQKKVKHVDHTWPSMGCRSFATVFNPPDLWENEVVRFNIGYKETYTVRELYEQSKTDPQLYKYRMFLRNEGYYKGDVNEIDHFEEIDEKVKLVCRPKSWGFFNGGVVTLNLPYIALESHGNKAEFWRLLDQRCELVYRTLVERYKSLKNAPSDAAPILRQDGVIARLTDDENWNNFIVGPRCTYSLGYAGLWETQLYMTGKKLTEDQSFANEILNFFNKKHDDWHTRIVDKSAVEKTQDILSEKEYPELVEMWNQNQHILDDSREIIFENYKDLEITEPNTTLKIRKLYKNKDGLIKAEVEKTIQRGWLNTSTYGTPQETLVGKLSDSLKRDFGFIEGVTDHDYVTNSYHVDPAEPIDWANKILIESKLMDKSTGGAISYIELPNMSDNLEAVESIIQFMYDHILYCELNLKRDICYKCGFQGVIKLVKDNGKRVWECPACRNRNTSEMFIRRRTCGYIGDANTGANQSRLADYEARVEHINIPLNMCNCGC